MIFILMYNLCKIIIMCYLYLKKIITNILIIKNDEYIYDVSHSCVISNEGEYIKDITNIVKKYNICPNTPKEFYKSLIKLRNVNVYIYLNGDIEIKHKID